MYRTMSTSILLLVQNFNANDVDIMVFELCVLFLPVANWEEIEHMVRDNIKLQITDHVSNSPKRPHGGTNKPGMAEVGSPRKAQK